MSLLSLFSKLEDGVKDRPLIIFTDVEPDDLLALLILFTHYQPTQTVQIVISAWQNQYHRADFLHHFLVQHFGHTVPFQIFLGLPTDKDYDLSPLMSKIPAQTLSSWEEVYFDSSAMILQLSPPQELLQLYRNGHDFSSNTLAMYGSFNVRSLLQGQDDLAIEFESMFGRFARVLYYENFPAASPEYVQDPSLTKQIGKIAMVEDYLRWWNTRIYQECQEDGDEWSQKIMASIDACPLQFVNADTGLVMSLLMPIESIPHLVTGVLDLPKFDPELNKYRPFPEIREMAPATIESRFLTIKTNETMIKVEHRAKMDEMLVMIALKDQLSSTLMIS